MDYCRKILFALMFLVVSMGVRGTSTKIKDTVRISEKF